MGRDYESCTFLARFHIMSDKQTSIEIIAVILLTIGRTIANDIGLMVWPGSISSRPFGYYQLTEFLRGIYLTGFVLLIVSLKQESFAEIGLSHPRWGNDLVVGVLVLIITVLCWAPFVLLFNLLGPISLHESPKLIPGPSGILDYLWCGLATAMAAFSEELLTRGYLISRLLRLCAPCKSVLLSAIIFSAWHISLGIVGVTHTFIWGLVYGFTFIQIRRVWPLAVAHTLNNVILDFAAAE